MKEERSKVQANSSGYVGDTSSCSSDFGTPPDRTDYLRLLYAGKGHLIPDEKFRPPARTNPSNTFSTSTPKKE